MLSQDLLDVPIDFADHQGDGHVIDDVRRDVVIDRHAQFLSHLNRLRIELSEKRMSIGRNQLFQIGKKKVELFSEKNQRFGRDDPLWKTVQNALRTVDVD